MIFFWLFSVVFEAGCLEQGIDSALSQDEQFLAIASHRGSSSVWRLKDDGMNLLATLRSDSARQTSMAFSPDGTVLVAGDQSGQFQIVDTATWQPQLAWSRPDRPLHCVRFSPDGRFLTVCSSDELTLWNLVP